MAFFVVLVVNVSNRRIAAVAVVVVVNVSIKLIA
jgi:hypothetical protein